MNKIKCKLKPTWGVWAIGMLFILNGCGGGSRMVNQLPPQQQEFLKTVKYLITKQEKKNFLNLTSDEERKAFIKKFWEKRDPEPTTEVNEYKEAYFERIDRANQLFGKNGWLTDRGRVLILLGPPETKRVFPTGQAINSDVGEPTIYNLPMEIWYYGYYNYPIVFVDRLQSGSYELTPLSAQHIATITRAGMMLQPQVGIQKQPLDFNVNVKKGDGGALSVQLNIPYKNILFQEVDNRYEATLTVTLEMIDAQGRSLPTFTKDFPLSMTDEDLQGKRDSYSIEIPLDMKSADGPIEMTATVESKNDQYKATKKISFNH